MATRGRKPAGKKAAANDDTANGDDSPGMGHNSNFDGDLLAEAIETIEGEETKIKKIMDAAKAKCEPFRKTIKTTKKALAEASYPVAETNAILRQRKLQAKATDEAIVSNFDDEQKERFAKLKEAIGPYIETPLGAYAVGKAQPADATVN